MEFTKKELYELINRPGPLWLVGADLKEANLSGALYDDATKWPDDFDPAAAGAIEV